MNTVGLHVDSVVNALGWTLLHFLWQGAAIAAVYAILCVVFNAGRANLRYNLGVLALFLMLLMPALTFLSIFQLPVAQGGPGEPLLSFSVQAAGAQATAWLATNWLAELGVWFDLLIPWAVAGWLAGVALLSRRLFKEWRQVKQLVRHNVKPLPANWQRVADSLHRLFGIRVVVRVLESGRASVPIVLGWLKPVILVPSSAILGLSQQQLEMLLAHEFAHIRRMDYLINLLQIFVETVLFYHPAVRWLSRRVRDERELCCDELVVELKGDSLVYAHALAGMEELRSLTPSIGMAASGGQLLTRIHRLSAAPVPQKGVLHWVVGLAVMASGLGMFAATRSALVTVGERGATVELTAPAEVSSLALAEKPVAEPMDSTNEAPPRQLASIPVDSPAVERPKEWMSEAPVVSVELVPQNPDPAPVTPVRMGGVDTRAVPAARQSDRAVLPDSFASAAPLLAAKPASIPGAVRPEPIRKPTAEDSSAGRPVFTGGRLLSGKQPRFSRKARLRGTEGWVTVRYTIDRNGRVRDAQTLESSNGRIFNKAVHRALATWQFEPFRQDGKVVERSVTRTIQFRIDPDAKIASGCVVVTGSRLCKAKRDLDIGADRLYQAKAN